MSRLFLYIYAFKLFVAYLHPGAPLILVLWGAGVQVRH